MHQAAITPGLSTYCQSAFTLTESIIQQSFLLIFGERRSVYHCFIEMLNVKKATSTLTSLGLRITQTYP